MATPKKFEEPRPLEARLVTKTSLPRVKNAMALLILLWYSHGKPGTLEYGLEEGIAKDGGILDEDIVNRVLNYGRTHNIAIAREEASAKLKTNPLIESQMESLNAAFELIWHLARFEFVNTSNKGAERTGGKRFRKRISYSTNIDLIDVLASTDEASLAEIVIAWLLDREVKSHEEERRLVRMLTVFSEQSFFKTSKGDAGTVFTQSGIYETLKDSGDVDIVDPGEEAQGTTRILKAAIGSGMNYVLQGNGSKVELDDNVTLDELDDYTQRAMTGIELSRVKVNLVEREGEEDTGAREENPEAPRNLIYFGAPGTGKSHDLDELAKKEFDEDKRRRVTFYPDYTYAQFVGGYKPVMIDGEIEYSFVPGPFIQTYMDAVRNPNENYLLIVEEINRANPAGVFGDIFQLLDRNSDGRSEYELAVPKELEDYFDVHMGEYHKNDKMDGTPAQFLEEEARLKRESKRLSIPPNMYIWATMNSADQGVFPMDTAFKRRWSFRYIGIDEGEDVIKGVDVPLGARSGRRAEWNEFRKQINEQLKRVRVNEDKLLGPFFIEPELIREDGSFLNAFKSKVLMYLIEDAAKTKKEQLFSTSDVTYSAISEKFDTDGEEIFNGIVLKHINPEPKEVEGQVLEDTESQG